MTEDFQIKFLENLKEALENYQPELNNGARE